MCEDITLAIWLFIASVVGLIVVAMIDSFKKPKYRTADSKSIRRQTAQIIAAANVQVNNEKKK